MRYNTLLALGATEVIPLKWWGERPKVSGIMFTGKGELALNGMKFFFEMWYHHEELTMTRQEAEEKISLKGIKANGRYYDIYWYCVLTEHSIWLHPTGWFGVDELGARVDKIRHPPVNEAQLTALGFTKILEY